MNNTTSIRQEVIIGAIFTCVGLIGLYVSFGYEMGSAMNMGPGYFPAIVCVGLAVVGLLIVLNAARLAVEAREGAAQTWEWRPMIFVTAAILAFGLTLRSFGVVIATTLLIAIAAFAGEESRPVEMTLILIGLLAFTFIVFLNLLGLSIPVWPGW